MSLGGKTWHIDRTLSHRRIPCRYLKAKRRVKRTMACQVCHAMFSGEVLKLKPTDADADASIVFILQASKDYIVAGDIGGTNARFQLWEIDRKNGSKALLFQQVRHIERMPILYLF